MRVIRTQVENDGLILFVAPITILLTLVVSGFIGALLWATLWRVLVTTLGGIDLVGLSDIVIDPVAVALFITAWQVLIEQRLGDDPENSPRAPKAFSL